jgi:hypothetical protein
VRSATAGCGDTAIRASRCSCSGALPPRCRCSNPSARLQCCRAAPTARPSRGLGGPPEAERAEQISVDAVSRPGAAWSRLRPRPRQTSNGRRRRSRPRRDRSGWSRRP